MRADYYYQNDPKTRQFSFRGILNYLNLSVVNVSGDLMGELYFDVSDEQEIFQYLVCDASQHDAQILQEYFDIPCEYHDLLGVYVIGVTHFGTAWDYVPVSCHDQEMASYCDVDYVPAEDDIIYEEDEDDNSDD